MQLNPMLGAFLGGMEIVLILAVVLLLFGAKKLPDLAKGLGTGIREFKKATQGVTDEIQNAAVKKQIAPAVSQSSNQIATAKEI
jgi:sec-independent protein translocase protein TatA